MIRIRPDAHGSSPKVSFVDAELTPPPPAPAGLGGPGQKAVDLKRGSSKRGSKKDYKGYPSSSSVAMMAPQPTTGDLKRSGTSGRVREGVNGAPPAGVSLYDPPVRLFSVYHA